MRFRDRSDAGRRLAAALASRGLKDPVVLGLARGGVPVGMEIALAMGAPLDVLVARKVGAPGQPEFGIGAVAEGDGVVANQAALDALGLREADFADRVRAEREEVLRRVQRYRRGRPLLDVAGRDAVVVDDGLATGVTAEAAVRAVRAVGPRRLLLAVPAGSAEAVARLGRIADEVLCLLTPATFVAVGQWYEHFAQVTDAEVDAALSRAGLGPGAG